MNAFFDLTRPLFRLVLRALLLFAGAVFALSLLLAAVVMLAFSLLGALLTGRKAAPVVFWQQFRDLRARRFDGGAFGRRARGTTDTSGRTAPVGDIVDVSSRDVTPR